MDKIFIKNMVCNRCIKSVAAILQNVGIAYSIVMLGEVWLISPINNSKKAELQALLQGDGFELLESSDEKLVNKIKLAAIEYLEAGSTVSFTDFLKHRLTVEPYYASQLFSNVTGLSIEKYLILQRIEKAKELMLYDELSLSQIADNLGYSSISHLSSQFKKTTGLTPSTFKKQRNPHRKPLDSV